ncbi:MULTISPECIES: Hcp family type VI secretion system effector [Pseudomonas syringae group]|uniref:Type VI secretion system tube protein Hcp n=3 Tax=Pseudomonas syringae group TaxID=136849 RepID=A0AAU8MC05_PSESX|nr:MULTISPECIES: type VI secretion system tube protein Hcp [Pseudomonas syringae group]KWS65228.1 Hcp1 family type VI secretion system effector [Pseudomonas amygdali pv. morsprunorum]POC82824.1 Hcp1 family type VI secretion system effector [Pseudomonas avellanae]POD00349.1 Hcp1 family type VI secretion system effector [Pseudomonas avellanae]POD14546.1 Hcp1 family type VI secretion system effector [Pseudomonas avellanae]QQN26621.1 type VI secretion system tube protein Hcp [Pseudomonas syringae 
MSFDAFMKVDGVEGESLDDGHKGWVELLSYHYNAMQSISQTASSSGGATAGGVYLGDFQISKYVDRATPKLFEICCKGTHIKNVTIRIHRAGTEKFKYLDIVLEEVLISLVSGHGADQSGLPIESVNLNFGRIKFEYSQQRRADGGSAGIVSGGWDRIAKKPFA